MLSLGTCFGCRQKIDKTLNVSGIHILKLHSSKGRQNERVNDQFIGSAGRGREMLLNGRIIIILHELLDGHSSTRPDLPTDRLFFLIATAMYKFLKENSILFSSLPRHG